jgi:hypothetical protein
MFHIIVFSYNRPMQLNSLLKSIQLYWKYPQIKVSIIYNCLGDNFEKGYDLLKAKYVDFSFIKETSKCLSYSYKEFLLPYNIFQLILHSYLRNPKSDFRFLLNNIINQSGCSHVLFLTDDSIFITNVNLEVDVLNFLDCNPSQNQFSLRLGSNMNNPPLNLKRSNNMLMWNFYDNSFYTNWGYPFSVDGHIYDVNIIRNILRKIIFCNPSSLESTVCGYVNRCKLFSTGASYSDTFLLSFPINMVQNIHNNESLGLSCALLNQKFLDGFELEYPIPTDIKYFQNYPHQLIFKKAGCSEFVNL